MQVEDYDVVVVGGGHAGVEAAAAAARNGVETILLTDDYSALGKMSCNPAVGGLSKGQIVLEIDALGGLMGAATEKTGIQFKMLNKSKGAAVQSPRAQCDRKLYQRCIQQKVENIDHLSVSEDRVIDLFVKNDTITGVKTVSGVEYRADSVVLATGTFLNGKIFIGLQNYPGGRRGEPASSRLAERLKEFGFKTARLKTGTPPRLDGRTVDLNRLREQSGDVPPPFFSYYRQSQRRNQRPCWLTETNPRTHDIIRSGLDRSPLYGTEEIEGHGVRYCPSIEDKIVRFPDRDSHNIFLEPEGLQTKEIYANGMPTSLPVDVQVDLIRSIDGLEEAFITRWGYAIEYDYIQPTQLHATLETQDIDGLFLAGQINGTTGYEEAAGQGLVAGVNAAARSKGEEDFVLQRTEAYIGVLIDDLVTKGTNEPYRMFTSRAEHRLQLRYDNAHYRLLPRAAARGLVSRETIKAFEREQAQRDERADQLDKKRVSPGSEAEKKLSKAINEQLDLDEGKALSELLKRPEVDVQKLQEAGLIELDLNQRVLEHLGVEIKYEGYIKRQQRQVQKQRRLEEKKIPTGFSYDKLSELSNESIEKLSRVRPDTVGQAERIPGIKPTDVQIIMAHLKGSGS